MAGIRIFFVQIKTQSGGSETINMRGVETIKRNVVEAKKRNTRDKTLPSRKPQISNDIIKKKENGPLDGFFFGYHRQYGFCEW